MAQIQLPAVAPFKPHGDPTSVSQRFAKWKKSFEYTRHYPQPVVSGWSMRRFEKLFLNIMIRGNFIADNELNSALSGSFLNSTGVHHRSSLDPRKQ